MAKKPVQKVLRITLVRSPIGYTEVTKRTVKALGFKHMHQTVEQPDNPAIRGMLAKVIHMITIEE
jgi:large subunit ribosomal protein L30